MTTENPNHQQAQSDKAQELVIDQLELKLTALASRWRYLHSRQFFSEAETVVQEYHAIVAELWSLGWNGRGLPLDSELPDRLMPDYYVAYWHAKSQKRQTL